ncbi:MAG: ECF transporter S component [Oscillospiraceae bacterium]
MKKSRFNIKTICMIGIMAALVFVGTNLRIKIPAGIDGTMIHFGNVFCLLGGLLFGGLPGGLAAGFGSALFDLFSEYAAEAWITFINKFAMGFIAGLIAHWGISKSKSMLRSIIAAVCGSLTYCVLYVGKTIIMQRFVYGLPWEGVFGVVAIKGTVTLINGMIAVVASLLLFMALKPALKRAHILE